MILRGKGEFWPSSDFCNNAQLEQNDEWQTASRYMMPEACARIDKEEIDPALSIITKAARSCPHAIQKITPP